MKKTLLLLVSLFAMMAGMAEELSVLTFPTYNSAEIASYTSSWKADVDGNVWKLVNFNNNKNGWSYVRCGSKKEAVTAEIITPAFDNIKAIEVKVDKATEFTKVSLVACKADTTVISTQDITTSIEATSLAFEVDVEGAKIYKLSFEMPVTSANGTVQISRVAVLDEYAAPAGPTEVTSIAEALALESGTDVILTNADGDNAYVCIYQNGKNNYFCDFNYNEYLLVYGDLPQYGSCTMIDQLAGQMSEYNGGKQLVPNTAKFGEATDYADYGYTLDMIGYAPTETTIDQVIGKTELHARWYKFQNMEVKEVNNKNFTITDGENELKGYNQFGITLPAVGDVVTVVGFLNARNGEIQIYPTKMAGIVPMTVAEINAAEATTEAKTSETVAVVAQYDNDEYWKSELWVLGTESGEMMHIVADNLLDYTFPQGELIAAGVQGAVGSSTDGTRVFNAEATTITDAEDKVTVEPVVYTLGDEISGAVKYVKIEGATFTEAFHNYDIHQGDASLDCVVGYGFCDMEGVQTDGTAYDVTGIMEDCEGVYYFYPMVIEEAAAVTPEPAVVASIEEALALADGTPVTLTNADGENAYVCLYQNGNYNYFCDFNYMSNILVYGELPQYSSCTIIDQLAGQMTEVDGAMRLTPDVANFGEATDYAEYGYSLDQIGYVPTETSLDNVADQSGIHAGWYKFNAVTVKSIDGDNVVVTDGETDLACVNVFGITLPEVGAEVTAVGFINTVNGTNYLLPTKLAGMVDMNVAELNAAETGTEAKTSEPVAVVAQFDNEEYWNSELWVIGTETGEMMHIYADNLLDYTLPQGEVIAAGVQGAVGASFDGTRVFIAETTTIIDAEEKATVEPVAYALGDAIDAVEYVKLEGVTFTEAFHNYAIHQDDLSLDCVVGYGFCDMEGVQVDGTKYDVTGIIEDCCGVNYFYPMVIEEAAEATGINAVSAEKAGAVYNVAGQRVENAQKGIFIINGKKVIK